VGASGTGSALFFYNGNTDGLDIYICLAAFDPLIQDSEKKAHRVRLIVLIAVLGSIFTALCGLSITIKMFQNTSSKKTFSDNDSLIVYDYSFFYSAAQIIWGNIALIQCSKDCSQTPN
jgi:hypothetical protein